MKEIINRFRFHIIYSYHPRFDYRLIDHGFSQSNKFLNFKNYLFGYLIEFKIDNSLKTLKF